MIRINYQSDFKYIEKSLNGDIILPSGLLTAQSCRGVLVAEFDGHGYKNCRRLDDGGLLVIFGRHGLRPGALSVKREYYLSDADFADGICNLVSVENTGVILVAGKTDESTAEIMSYPDYAAYNAVQSVPLSEREYDDVLSDFIPPLPPEEK